VVESYYQARWGYADEFLRLYKKNHLPILKKLQEEGRILRIDAAKPRYHATEDSRWDYRVTLTFRDAVAAHDPAHEEAVKRQLYPDQDALRKEEQRRFEILNSHWDVVIDGVDLDAK
jgi:L-lysine 2,3-aminomutase